jgi:hypothetical protein
LTVLVLSVAVKIGVEVAKSAIAKALGMPRGA